MNRIGPNRSLTGPNVTVAVNPKVGKDRYVGIGMSPIHGVGLGDAALTGSVSNLVCPAPEPTTASGNPVGKRVR